MRFLINQSNKSKTEQIRVQSMISSRDHQLTDMIVRYKEAIKEATTSSELLNELQLKSCEILGQCDIRYMRSESEPENPRWNIGQWILLCQ